MGREKKVVNRESLPLIAGLLIPIFLVSLILLYIYSNDILMSFIDFLKSIHILYWLVIIPFIIGFIVIIVKYLRPS